MKLKLKKSKEATVPFKGSLGAAGYDMVAISVKKKGWLFPTITVNTGVHLEIPNGYVGLIFPRSSVTKKKLLLGNSIGVIDPDYTGPIIFKFRGLPFSKKYKVGDRIGQLIVIKKNTLEFEEVEELDKTARGDKGFGSTGK